MATKRKSKSKAVLVPAVDERREYLQDVGVCEADIESLLQDCPLECTELRLRTIANDWLEAHGRLVILPDPREVHRELPPWKVPTELREYCQTLRNDWLTDDPSDSACFAQYWITELWRAMRAMSGTTAPPTEPQLVATIHDCLLAVDEVVRWCDVNTMPKKRHLTEPMTLQDIAKYFTCHRNQVRKSVLSKYWHEEVGRKYRMQIGDMPTAYHVYHSRQHSPAS